MLQALEQAEQLVPLFLWNPEEELQWTSGAASRWWLHHSLGALEQSIEKLGGQLVIQRGPSLATLRRIVKQTGATLVCWNKLFEPAALARDAGIAKALADDGVSVEQCNSTLLFEPGTILNKQQLPYRVFTPFWRTLEKELATLPAPQRSPRKLPTIKQSLKSVPIRELSLLPKIRWMKDSRNIGRPAKAAR